MVSRNDLRDKVSELFRDYCGDFYSKLGNDLEGYLGYLKKRYQNNKDVYALLYREVYPVKVLISNDAYSNARRDLVASVYNGYFGKGYISPLGFKYSKFPLKYHYKFEREALVLKEEGDFEELKEYVSSFMNIASLFGNLMTYADSIYRGKTRVSLVLSVKKGLNYLIKDLVIYDESTLIEALKGLNELLHVEVSDRGVAIYDINLLPVNNSLGFKPNEVVKFSRVVNSFWAVSNLFARNYGADRVSVIESLSEVLFDGTLSERDVRFLMPDFIQNRVSSDMFDNVYYLAVNCFTKENYDCEVGVFPQEAILNELQKDTLDRYALYVGQSVAFLSSLLAWFNEYEKINATEGLKVVISTKTFDGRVSKYSGKIRTLDYIDSENPCGYFAGLMDKTVFNKDIKNAYQMVDVTFGV